MVSQLGVSKRKRRKVGELRDDILEAARAVFMEKGYAASSTREIAERACAAEPLIFRQFERKANLFAAAVFTPLENTLHSQIERTLSMYGGAFPPAEHGIRQYVEAIISTARENKRLFIAYINALTFHANDFSFPNNSHTPPSLQNVLVELEKSSDVNPRSEIKIHDTHFELRIILLFLLSVGIFDDLVFSEEERNESRILASVVKLLTMGVGLTGPGQTPQQQDRALYDRLEALEDENRRLREIVVDQMLNLKRPDGGGHSIETIAVRE